jgi:small-conductance mechanosensitive channel
MKTSRAVQTFRSDRAIRIHILILYLLIACLTILWGVFFIYYAQTIRAYSIDLSHVKKRLFELEETQITITSAVDGHDPSNRRLKHARILSKILNKQQQQNEHSDLFEGSIHFKVPVRRSEN